MFVLYEFDILNLYSAPSIAHGRIKEYLVTLENFVFKISPTKEVSKFSRISATVLCNFFNFSSEIKVINVSTITQKSSTMHLNISPISISICMYKFLILRFFYFK